MQATPVQKADLLARQSLWLGSLGLFLYIMATLLIMGFYPRWNDPRTTAWMVGVIFLNLVILGSGLAGILLGRKSRKMGTETKGAALGGILLGSLSLLAGLILILVIALTIISILD